MSGDALNTVPLPAHRRVLVGLHDGGSAVVEDSRALPRTRLANGIVLQEVWQQPRLPACRDDLPDPDRALGPAAPTEGVVVRILTLPGSSERPPSAPDLHSDPSLHVITMIEGRLVVVLEEGEVRLEAGDSIVLRDHLHDLRNDGSVAATFVYTSMPLT